MQYGLTITAVSKDFRLVGSDRVWGCKEPSGAWVNLHQEERPLKGFVNVDLIEKDNGKGGVWRDAYLSKQPIKPAQEPQQATEQGQPNQTPVQPDKPTLTGVEIIILRVFQAYHSAAKMAGVELKNEVSAMQAISATINTAIMAYAQKDREPLTLGTDLVPAHIRAAYEEVARNGWEEMPRE